MTEVLYDIIYIVPLSLVPVIMTGGYFVKRLPEAAVFAAGVAVSVFCVMIWHLKARGKILLGGIAAAFLTGTVIIAEKETISEHTGLLWIALVVVACFVIGKAANRYIWFKAVLAFAGTVSLILMMIYADEIKKGLFTVVISYVTVAVSEIIQVFWRKEGNTGIREHVVYMFPFILTVILLVSLIKAPDRPYDWRFVKEFAKNVRTRYEIIVQSLFPDNGWDGGDTMGFSDRAAIGGRVSGEPYKVLSVSSDTDIDRRLYLEGKSFDTFDGRKWIKTDDSDMDYRSMDLLETITAVRSISEGNESDYLKMVRLWIRYEGLRTSHLFTPAKSIPDISAVATSQTGGDMMTGGSKAAEYSIRYYRLNMDDPSFRKMLEEGAEVTAQDRQRTIEEHNELIKKTYSEDDWEKYHERIYDIYARPADVSDRTENFLKEYLDGAGSDMEKLTRIEKLLSSFRYTRTPGDLPETVSSDTDFLDYFLFEKKEGFCTHFATAFVLLARSQGIPARYVQGYSTLMNSRRFDVESDRTHAWPEVYLPGAGWIVFEPTPGYRQEMGWDKTGSAKAGTSPESVHSIYKGTEGDPEDYGEAEDNDRTGTALLLNSINMRLIRTVLLIVIIFLIVFLVSDHFYRDHRYRHMSERDRTVQQCKKTIKMLERAGYRIGKGETLEEFGNRLSGVVPDDILGFTDIYEKVLYAADADCSKDVSVTEKCAASAVRFAVSQMFKRFMPVRYRS